jgi:hypothetical protein
MHASLESTYLSPSSSPWWDETSPVGVPGFRGVPLGLAELTYRQDGVKLMSSTPDPPIHHRKLIKTVVFGFDPRIGPCSISSSCRRRSSGRRPLSGTWTCASTWLEAPHEGACPTHRVDIVSRSLLPQRSIPARSTGADNCRRRRS